MRERKIIITLILLFILVNLPQSLSTSYNVFLTSKTLPLVAWYNSSNPSLIYYLIPYAIEEKWLPFFDPYFLIKNTTLTKSNLIEQLFKNIQGVNYTLVNLLKSYSDSLLETLDFSIFFTINKTKLLNSINELEKLNNMIIETSFPITLSILDFNKILIDYNKILKELKDYITNTENINTQKLQEYKSSLTKILSDNLLPFFNFYTNLYNNLLILKNYKETFKDFYIKLKNYTSIESYINANGKIIGKNIEFRHSDYLSIYVRIYNQTVTEDNEKIILKLNPNIFILSIFIKSNYNYNSIKKLNITNFFKPYLIIKLYIGILYEKNLTKIEEVIKNNINFLKNEKTIYKINNTILPFFNFTTKMKAPSLIFYPINKQEFSSNVTVLEKQYYYVENEVIKELKIDKYVMIENGLFSLNIVIPYNEDMSYFNVNIIGGFNQNINEDPSYNLKISYLPKYEVKIKSNEIRSIYDDIINKFFIILLLLALIFLYINVIKSKTKIKLIKDKKHK